MHSSFTTYFTMWSTLGKMVLHSANSGDSYNLIPAIGMCEDIHLLLLMEI